MPQTTYQDPNRLFTIRVPEGFERDAGAKSLVFRHPDIDGAVTVSCLRHRTGDAEVNLFDALPSRDNMRNVKRSEINGAGVVYGDHEGELQHQTEYWRWWTMQRGPVGIVVSFNGDPDARREPVDAFVGGIEISETPPIGVESFTQIAADVYARTLDKPKPEILRPLELNTGEKSKLGLENAYISYMHAWDEDPNTDPNTLLEQWFEHLWGETNRDLGPFEEVRGLIYPVVKAWNFARNTDVPILRRPIVDGELELLAAVDTGRTLRFVTTEDVEKWDGVDAEEVFFFARENLQALAEDMELQALTGPDGKPRAVIIASGDSYDASRLMLPTLYEKLSEVIGENLLVGVPNRDFMIVLTADDEELVGNVSAQVKIDCESRPYAISPKLFKLTKDGVEAR
ncbi:MAG: DUF1444 family protein [Planctomycetota bacterium]